MIPKEPHYRPQEQRREGYRIGIGIGIGIGDRDRIG